MARKPKPAPTAGPDAQTYQHKDSAVQRPDVGLQQEFLKEKRTTRKTWGAVAKCHLNLCVADTQQWEQSAAYCLDVHPAVAAWVKNDHLGLQIRYRKGNRSHHYLPDFVARLTDGRYLLIEVKGELGDAEIKQGAARRWCAGVNRHGGFGAWSYHLLRHPADLMQIMDRIGFGVRGDRPRLVAMTAFSVR